MNRKELKYNYIDSIFSVILGYYNSIDIIEKISILIFYFDGRIL